MYMIYNGTAGWTDLSTAPANHKEIMVIDGEPERAVSPLGGQLLPHGTFCIQQPFLARYLYHIHHLH